MPAPPAIATSPGETRPPGGGTMGARAIYKPMPDIPDELRHRNLHFEAMARFRVATDGAAEVELTEATPVPSLNRALLEALKKWRFFPAMEEGRPIASTIDIRIPIQVQ